MSPPKNKPPPISDTKKPSDNKLSEHKPMHRLLVQAVSGCFRSVFFFAILKRKIPSNNKPLQN